jgi:AcrR family transcriptional regulator
VTVITMYDHGMGRWEPDARGRLERAALELYRERGFEGFDEITVAEIAERAGLTERTFFRHYTDKREILFSGASELQRLLVSAVEEAPAGLAPMAAVASGLFRMADAMFDEERREFARQRQRIIAVNPDLVERELIKMATLGAALAGALRGRGVGEPAASLAGEAGIAVFRVAFERWVSPGCDQSLSQLMRESVAELRAVTAASEVTSPT